MHLQGRALCFGVGKQLGVPFSHLEGWEDHLSRVMVLGFRDTNFDTQFHIPRFPMTLLSQDLSMTS